MSLKALKRRLIWPATVMLGAWMVGLLIFIWVTNQGYGDSFGPQVDGIVVFAGGEGRISAGLDALNAGRGRRLLISGVDPNLDNHTILSAYEGLEAKEDCCIDLGRTALDTRGNVLESLDWARQHGFRNLLIISANYHLPRGLAEFRCFGGEVTVIPEGIDSSLRFGALAVEYSKYLVSLVRPCPNV